MPTYTYSQLKSDVNGKIKGKIGVLVNPRSTINQGVRQAFSEIDFLTSRRKTQLTPNLFSGVFEYAAPSDLKGYGIITIQNQTFAPSKPWGLVPYEQFLRRQDLNTIAVSDYDGVRKIMLNASVDDDKITVSDFNSETNWTAVGDAENIDTDTTDYITSSASLTFGISSAGGTTAGVQNSSISTIDLTDYLTGNGVVTVWVKIASTTNLTNYIMRIGTDSSNYYSKTVTAQADGTAFVAGWNLLKFDLTSLTETGTVTDTACTYSALYMTKDALKVSETGYKFDDMVLHNGEINYIYYYSGYGWQTSGGTYIQNSTADSDLLNAGEEEYEIILAKCAEVAADEVDEENASQKQEIRYEKLKRAYQMGNPSESLIMVSTTADFIEL
jgi:hypothetical protein